MIMNLNFVITNWFIEIIMIYTNFEVNLFFITIDAMWLVFGLFIKYFQSIAITIIMPRVSLSTDYLLDRYYQIPSLITNDEELSPDDIDKILSRKLYEQLNAGSTTEKGWLTVDLFLINEKFCFISIEHLSTTAFIDPELIILIDRFFNLTYQNTIPMVNLLATAVSFPYLNIRKDIMIVGSN